MNGYILCCGTGNPLTSPSPAAIAYENRHYGMAPPGEIHRYGLIDPAPAITKGDSRFGLVIIEDLLERTLVPAHGTIYDTAEKQFNDNLIFGHDRAKAIVDSWTGRIPNPNYGAALVPNGEVTDEMILKCKTARRAYAVARLASAIKGVRSASHGRAGNIDYSPADHAWAAEIGKALPTAAELLNDMPKTDILAVPSEDADRIPCPECGEEIKAAARVCHFCKKKFNMPLNEFIAQQEVVTQ